MLTIQYYSSKIGSFRYYSVIILPIQIQRSLSLVLLICTRKRPSRVRGPEMVTFNTWPYWRRNDQGDKLLSDFRVVMMLADTKPCVARRLHGLGVPPLALTASLLDCSTHFPPLSRTQHTSRWPGDSCCSDGRRDLTAPFKRYVGDLERWPHV